MKDTFSPTISVPNVAPGMVLDFDHTLIATADEAVYLGEAEVISVDKPSDTVNLYVLTVSPEDGSTPELSVTAYEWQSIKIAG